MPWTIFIPVVLVSLLVVSIELLFVIAAHPRARAAGIVAIIGFVLFPVAIVLHNVVSAIVGGEEALSFIVALFVAPAVTMLGLLGVGAALWPERAARAFAAMFGLAGVGLAIFVAYAVLTALAVQVLGERDITGLTLVALALSGGAIVVAAVASGFALVSGRDASIAAAPL